MKRSWPLERSPTCRAAGQGRPGLWAMHRVLHTRALLPQAQGPCTHGRCCHKRTARGARKRRAQGTCCCQRYQTVHTPQGRGAPDLPCTAPRASRCPPRQSASSASSPCTGGGRGCAGLGHARPSHAAAPRHQYCLVSSLTLHGACLPTERAPGCPPQTPVKPLPPVLRWRCAGFGAQGSAAAAAAARLRSAGVSMRARLRSSCAAARSAICLRTSASMAVGSAGAGVRGRGRSGRAERG